MSQMFATRLHRVFSMVVLFTLLITTLAAGNSNDASVVYLPAVMKESIIVPPIVPETTEVLPEDTLQNLTEISESGVFTFTQGSAALDDVDVGDVIVGDVAAAAPNGFLRTVDSITDIGGQVVLNTSNATLEDAIQQGSARVSKRLTPADIKSMTTQPGVNLVRQSTGMTLEDSFFFEINDVVLYDDDGNLATTYDQIKANGSLELAPDFDFNLVIEDWVLQNLEFVFNVEENVELEFQVEVELVNVELAYEIARLHLGTITIFIGPVPIVFLIEMPINLKADGAVSVGITTKVIQQASLSAGLRYQDGSWSPVADLNNSFGFEPPRLSAGVELKGYIDPPLSLLLYGVAGPFAGVTPYLKLEADIFATPWWELYGGLDATVGLIVEVLGHSLGNHTEVVIGYRILLAQASEPPPIGVTSRVSVASDGTEGNGGSGHSAISADGRYVAFGSYASNLVPGDTNGYWDVFLHDRQTGQTSRVSVASDGTQGNEDSYWPAISADGRYMAFYSQASNLVPGDTNGYTDVFVYDQQTGQTSRVSVASDGAQGNGNSYFSAISADGRYVAFGSRANTLVPSDTNSYGDIFVHDRQTGQTSRVSVASDGAEGNNDSYNLDISADGRYVAFDSWASNLVPADTNGSGDIFVYDRQTGQTSRVSVASDNTQGNSQSSNAAISADGRYVAFDSDASNLVPGDTNGRDDVFVHDRQTGQTSRISVASDGTQGNNGSSDPAVSTGGRYVTFYSFASSMVPGDTNGCADVFVHDRQTGQTSRVSVASDSAEGNSHSYWPAISADGRYLALYSEASNLVPGDTNNDSDIFVHDREPASKRR